MEPTLGVGLGARRRIDEVERQAVLDAAAVLQLRRAELLSAMTEGTVPGVDIPCRGQEDTNRWLAERCVHQWRELLSVRATGTVAALRLSLPNNRLAVDRGLQMISVFDQYGLTDSARRLLAGERLGTYLIGIGTVNMNIVDRKFVLLQGPRVEGEPTLMAVRESTCLGAAWAYWHRIMESAYPVTDSVHDPVHDDRVRDDAVHDGSQLSARQRQIMAVLATGAQDEVIASAVGVSVRTVRSDIAAVMRILGVRSRFAAGIRFHEITEATG